MEFKDHCAASTITAEAVDIGTEWNLKMASRDYVEHLEKVDIGTEWNLKAIRRGNDRNRRPVDIGTEWNLKLSIRPAWRI